MLSCMVFGFSFTHTSYSILCLNFYKGNNNFTSFRAINDLVPIEGEKNSNV